MLLGVGLWVGYSVQFDAEDKLEYKPNLGTIKGSPYGKVLALAMQGPIDIYWHSGQSHEHAETLNAEHDHPHGGGHDHSHGDHSHGSHGHEDHAEPVAAQLAPEKAAKSAPKKTLLRWAKDEVRLMAATARRKTDGKPLTPAHRKYLQSVTEDKLRLAYDLDPTNYTNYGNLHLFLMASNLGKSAADDNKAVQLASQTLQICKKESIDPQPWLTAASAAFNIVFHIGRYHNEFTVAEAKASLAEFDYCIDQYEILLNDAVENGRIISEARWKELNERARYLSKLREAQGVYMKRVMTNHMNKTTTPPSSNN